MQKENLAIITNEKTSYFNKSFFCDNIDAKSIPEGLNDKFNIKLFVRDSKIKRSSHKINLKNIVISGGITNYIKNIFKSHKFYKRYLIISLSPYTFIISILLFFLRKKVFLYLRSDGYEEYKCYSKYFGEAIYHIMFTIASLKSNLIACRPRILRGKKGKIVSPSQLNEKWFKNLRKINSKKIKLLYVGRIKIEKGIFSLFEILKKINIDFIFTIINSEKFFNKEFINKKIKIINYKNRNDSIINIYDKNLIFILPSFTEGHPQVLDESLARLRPVIIFPEISHVKRNRKGVFICERNSTSLNNKIKFILKNYKIIQKQMKTNKLPNKITFLNEITKIIKQN